MSSNLVLTKAEEQDVIKKRLSDFNETYIQPLLKGIMKEQDNVLAIGEAKFEELSELTSLPEHQRICLTLKLYHKDKSPNDASYTLTISPNQNNINSQCLVYLGSWYVYPGNFHYSLTGVNNYLKENPNKKIVNSKLNP